MPLLETRADSCFSCTTYVVVNGLCLLVKELWEEEDNLCSILEND